MDYIEDITQVAVPAVDSGNTAWMIVATILVLLMTIPGIALFYGGLVRQKNVLSIIMQCLLIVGVISILWVAFGYSFVFGTSLCGTAAGSVIGGFDKVMLNGVTPSALTTGNIPEIIFVVFQCMFAVITPALILGAFAERIKFSGFMLFTILWSILVYNPMAHWVWGGGWLQEMGAIDFAGGTVVHINAGISALVMAVLLGKRRGYRVGQPMSPHNVTFVFMGTAFLWLGWFGFNAGSGLQADGIAANAFSGDALGHLRGGDDVDADRLGAQQKADDGRRVYRSGGRTGCHYACRRHRKRSWSRLHRASFLGRLLFHGGRRQTEIQIRRRPRRIRRTRHGRYRGFYSYRSFATRYISGEGGVEGALYGDWHQLWVQVVATAVSVVFSAAMTYILFKIVDKLVGLRVDARVEEEGLDIYEHGESAYNS